MKSVHLLPIVVLTWCLVSTGFAERILPRGEILEIFGKLTEEPRQTWIAAGTIEARHQEHSAAKTTDAAAIRSAIQDALDQYQSEPDKREWTEQGRKLRLEAIPFNVRYKLTNEYTMSSHVLVRYDGERFYWEINVDGRQDSVRPDAELAGNFMTERFDPDWNGRRIFAWDGRAYTTYTASGRRALVDRGGTLPRAVNGPLTAGLIPWGYGRFTSAALAGADVAATERQRDDGARVEINIIHADGFAACVVLDPARDYAVTKATLTSADGETIRYTCSDYRRVGNRRVPFRIGIERRDGATNMLRRSEQWTFDAVDDKTGAGDSFDVPFSADAVVEYSLPLLSRHLTCDYSPTADLDGLLAQYLAGARGNPRNCATAALQYALSKLGKTPRDLALSRLVGRAGQTTLYDMKRLARDTGLHCRAVRIYPASLQKLAGTVAILHLPGRNHFVVLDEVDGQYVWLIDLLGPKFYARQGVEPFAREWSEGTALLLSDRSITGAFTEIPDSALKNFIGTGGWSCTQLVQEAGWEPCELIGGSCQGFYRYYWERWGCEPASSGTCIETSMVRFQDTACLDHPVYGCTISGEWEYYPMQACW